MHIAVVGATGAVGREMCSILAQRCFPADRVSLLASARSAGKTVDFGGRTLTMAELLDGALAGVDIALFSATALARLRFPTVDPDCAVRPRGHSDGTDSLRNHATDWHSDRCLAGRGF